MDHVSCFKDNIYFLFVFDLKKQGKGLCQSDKCNPIMKINLPSTFHPSPCVSHGRSTAAALIWPPNCPVRSIRMKRSRGAWPASPGSTVRGSHTTSETAEGAAPGDTRAWEASPDPPRPSGRGKQPPLTASLTVPSAFPKRRLPRAGYEGIALIYFSKTRMF